MINLNSKLKKFVTPKVVKQTIIIACTFNLIISLLVIIGWLFNSLEILKLISNGLTINFNTALLFVILNIAILIYIKKIKFFKIINIFLVNVVIVIALLTLSEYAFNFDYSIIQDTFLSNLHESMSPIAALCFLLLGIAMWGIQSKMFQIKKCTQYILLLVILFSVVVIVEYILQLSIKQQSSIINLMAIYPAVMFLLISSTLFLKNGSQEFYNLVFSKHTGSEIIRVMVPYNLIMILLMGITLLFSVNNNLIDFNFGFIVYSILAVFVSIISVIIVAFKINKSEVEREIYKNSLHQANLELNQLKQALDESSIVAITDAKGIITSVNNKFCEISQYSRDELIGKSHKIINSGHHSKAFFRDLWRTIKSGNVWIGGVKNRAKDGSFYWVHTSIIPFKNENDEIYQFFTIRQDITRLTMLSHQYENLQLKNKEIEQFTYIASHDLQEPLRSIKGMVNILKQKQIDQIDEVTNNCICYIERSTDRMSSLIKGLLDYSRIGVNKKLEVVDINNLLKSLKNELSVSIKDSGTKIYLENLPTIKAYKNELYLLFLNLVTNAIKFQKNDTHPQIKITATKSGQYWKFSVSDNGIGIENIKDRNIFGIFQRLNRRGNFDGTGIGLAHCDKIIHLHGGEIWAESKLGEGSIFYFTIPIILN
ncbi:ATP-binding protein [Lutibacter sp. A80]|uniref:sensor histidine kinase n=1 Tax=Lutibacter sp. A80 TaxID=2918453 RepID=UPI001F067699|nr:ATP-binding protein [Lutibacter sp. A80]UMB59617.1 ATP-binding protein [Lutibacter sp. A80]